MSIETLSHDLRLAKDRKQCLEDELKECNAEITDIEGKLSDLMIDECIDKFSNEYGSFSLNIKSYYSPKADRKDTVYELLEDIEPGLVRRNVNPQTFNAFMRQSVEDNGGMLPDWADGIVNVYDKTTINVRRN